MMMKDSESIGFYVLSAATHAVSEYKYSQYHDLHCLILLPVLLVTVV